LAQSSRRNARNRVSTFERVVLLRVNQGTELTQIVALHRPLARTHDAFRCRKKLSSGCTRIVLARWQEVYGFTAFSTWQR